ncbi:hypothetical protein CYMTET_13669 [Cymbomonas tetramitiformis]|uniref:Uncharacterized protein n=1 Tax=Cymbomonas tetramitiformis TaxID=36881 RepID=A0AAE0LAY9_9CHLO|nr:hypothetical protein CYMTET_13669 [Cymbomonas tetramitiformis]
MNLQFPTEFEHLRYGPGFYDHYTLCHAAAVFLKKYGSMIRYSSWVTEALNKLWKKLLKEYTTCGGGREGQADAGKQALIRMLRMTDPRYRKYSMRFPQDPKTKVKTCRKCLHHRDLGHYKVLGQEEFLLLLGLRDALTNCFQT